MKSAQPCCPSLNECLTSIHRGDCADAKLYLGSRPVWDAWATPHRRRIRRWRGHFGCRLAASATGRAQAGVAESGGASTAGSAQSGSGGAYDRAIAGAASVRFVPGLRRLERLRAVRLDPALHTALDKRGKSAAEQCGASSPTLCRFESRANRKAVVDLHRVLVDQFIASFAEPPQELILDLRRDRRSGGRRADRTALQRVLQRLLASCHCTCFAASSCW